MVPACPQVLLILLGKALGVRFENVACKRFELMAQRFVSALDKDLPLCDCGLRGLELLAQCFGLDLKLGQLRANFKLAATGLCALAFCLIAQLMRVGVSARARPELRSAATAGAPAPG